MIAMVQFILLLALEAILLSAFGRVIGLQFCSFSKKLVLVKNDSSFGIKLITPLRCEIDSQLSHPQLGQKKLNKTRL